MSMLSNSKKLPPKASLSVSFPYQRNSSLTSCQFKSTHTQNLFDSSEFIPENMHWIVFNGWWSAFIWLPVIWMDSVINYVQCTIYLISCLFSISIGKSSRKCQHQNLFGENSLIFFFKTEISFSSRKSKDTPAGLSLFRIKLLHFDWQCANDFQKKNDQQGNLRHLMKKIWQILIFFSKLPWVYPWSTSILLCVLATTYPMAFDISLYLLNKFQNIRTYDVM